MTSIQAQAGTAFLILHLKNKKMMNTLKIAKEQLSGKGLPDYKFTKRNGSNYMGYLLLGLLMLLWPFLQRMVRGSDPAIGFIDPNIWLLILLSLICFLVVIGLCWWLLHGFWISLGLPLLGDMVLQFKKMESWQQLRFYWLSFVLLVLAAVGCLNAIC